MSDELEAALDALIEAASTAAEIAASGARDRQIRAADEDVSAARSRVEALCRPQWQPIETAPKDGTKVLGWNEEFGARQTRNITYTEGSYGHSRGLPDRWWEWEEKQSLGQWKPTRWMPLPPPPGAAPTPPAPAQRRGRPLPAHELVTMYDEHPMSDAEMIEFARAVERAHGIGDSQ